MTTLTRKTSTAAPPAYAKFNGTMSSAAATDSKSSVGSSPSAMLAERPVFFSESTPPYFLKWMESWTYLLADIEGVKVFRKFLTENDSAYLLDFYFACSGLRKIQPGEEYKLRSLIRAIYRNFIRNEQLSLVLSADTRKSISDQVLKHGVADASIFAAAQLQVENELKRVSYPAFLKSAQFAQYVEHSGGSNSGKSSNGSSEADYTKLKSAVAEKSKELGLGTVLAEQIILAEQDAAVSAMAAVLAAAARGEKPPDSFAMQPTPPDTLAKKDSDSKTSDPPPKENQPERTNADAPQMAFKQHQSRSQHKSLAPAPVKERNLAETDPPKFARVLIDRLKAATSTSPTVLMHQARLQTAVAAPTTITAPVTSRFPSTVPQAPTESKEVPGANADHRAAPNNTMCNSETLPPIVSAREQSDSEKKLVEDAQSILEAHCNRIWDVPGCFSPLRQHHSPSTASRQQHHSPTTTATAKLPYSPTTAGSRCLSPADQMTSNRSLSLPGSMKCSLHGGTNCSCLITGMTMLSCCCSECDNGVCPLCGDIETLSSTCNCCGRVTGGPLPARVASAERSSTTGSAVPNRRANSHSLHRRGGSSGGAGILSAARHSPASSRRCMPPTEQQSHTASSHLTPCMNRKCSQVCSNPDSRCECNCHAATPHCQQQPTAAPNSSRLSESLCDCCMSHGCASKGTPQPNSNTSNQQQANCKNCSSLQGSSHHLPPPVGGSRRSLDTASNVDSGFAGSCSCLTRHNAVPHAGVHHTQGVSAHKPPVADKVIGWMRENERHQRKTNGKKSPSDDGAPTPTTQPQSQLTEPKTSQLRRGSSELRRSKPTPSSKIHSGLARDSGTSAHAGGGGAHAASHALPGRPSTTSQLEEAKRRLESDIKTGGRSCKPKIARERRTSVEKFRSNEKSQSTSSKSSESTIVGFYFCDEPIPYRTSIATRRATLRQFKQLLNKKGNFRFYFKKATDEFENGVVNEEIADDDAVLPLWEGKIFAKVVVVT